MNRTTTLLAACLILAACSRETVIEVTNPSGFDRPGEVIEIGLDRFGAENTGDIFLRDPAGKILPLQWMDLDTNGSPDHLVFVADLKARSKCLFHIGRRGGPHTDSLVDNAFCRYVPERMGDFAWENDRVAFRMYGPECQRLAKEGKPEGLVSSGIDCWLKRVSYPIIDRWYRKESTGGSYHRDDGEGLDNFTVGPSRGCGGTAIRSGGKYIVSENFTTWKVIANGPIRCIFELSFEPVQVNGKPVSETKRFTLNLGSNLFRCDITYGGAGIPDTVGIGLVIHDSLSGISGDPVAGWISCWESLDDSFLGMGILTREGQAGPSVLPAADRDGENYWMLVAPMHNRLTYYAGFGWAKSGRFPDAGSWNAYLEEQSRRLNHPLEITILTR